MNKAFYKSIVESGVRGADLQEKKTIVLSNYLALILIGVNIIFLIIPGNRNLSWFLETCVAVFLFALPIVLNRFGFYTTSRLYLCWCPPVLITWVMIMGMQGVASVPGSTYVGVRFYLLATSCIPYLMLDKNKTSLFIAGIAPSFIGIVFCDPILEWAGVGVSTKGVMMEGYSLTLVRTLVSYAVINASCFALKIIIDQSDSLNQKLLNELAEKTQKIREQSTSEVNQLNEQLRANLSHLEEREFILNHSQRIAKIGSWEYRIKNSFLFWSDEMYNIFGLDKSFDLKAKNLSQVMWADQNEILIDSTIELLRTGRSYDLTLRAKTPIGYMKWVRLQGDPIMEDGQIIGVRGTCHDITYYKESQELLQKNEFKYRSLFEQASDSIIIVDFHGNFIDVNVSLCTMLGYTKSELLQLNISNLLDREQLQERPIRFDQLALSEHIVSERRMLHKDGRVIEVEANVKRFAENSVLAILRDTTELRKAQRETFMSEARFRGAFEESPIGMTLVSVEGKWLRVNKEFCNITGYEPDELLTMSFQQLTHPEDVEYDLKTFQQSVGDGENYRLRKRYIHKKGYAVWVNLNVSAVKDSRGKPLYFVAQIEDITEFKKAEDEKEYALFLLNERIKELTTLYRTSQLLSEENKTPSEVLEEIVSVLPLGWKYPEITAARIRVDKTEYKTTNFKAGVNFQNAAFITGDGATGEVEIVYLEERPSEMEGPFMTEERDLINMIAGMIQAYLVRNHEEDALSVAQANLAATINNTEIMIWSVDRHYKLLTFNKSFYEYILATYGIEIKLGTEVLESSSNPELIELAKRWEQFYLKALAGEIVAMDEVSMGKDLHFSLSPIIENNQVIGVSIFVDDITERKTQDQQLAEANKKISELKLMALRSVMSPHFIFNVLNSIQYFIAKNDRINAINYLSTFSKLIRSVLSHSVTNKIKLAEEIDMLKNYVYLEMTRFENKFEFIFNVASDLDIDAIEIPSLLIQPYVENAILHGLYNKQEKGLLTITVCEDPDEAVIFEIEDNGIGRKAAMELRQQNFPAHKSMGIKVTEERLKLINNDHRAAFEIHDLEKDGQPAGTKVRIRIMS